MFIIKLNDLMNKHKVCSVNLLKLIGERKMETSASCIVSALMSVLVFHQLEISASFIC